MHPLMDAYEELLRDPEPGPGAAGEPDIGGGAAAPEYPPPLPPPADPAPLLARAENPIAAKRQRGADVVVAVLDHGTVTYYVSHKTFEANCFAHAEERCTVGRKVQAAGSASSSSDVVPVRRPLGLLCAWLQVANCCEEDTKADRKKADRIKTLCSREQRGFRADCRAALQAVPGGRELLALEGPALGEGLEAEP